MSPSPRSLPSSWVAVRTLGARHQARVVGHLLALDAHDRYLRFGRATSDAQIERYVQDLDFDRDELCGIFDRCLQLVAVAHLAFDGGGRAAEFGVSVLMTARGRGLGARLFRWAMLHARNRGVTTLVVHALVENAAMLKIARRAGSRIVREGPDARATLQLPHDNFASRVVQRMQRHAADIDYAMKRRGWWLDGWHCAWRAAFGRDASS